MPDASSPPTPGESSPLAWPRLKTAAGTLPDYSAPPVGAGSDNADDQSSVLAWRVETIIEKARKSSPKQGSTPSKDSPTSRLAHLRRHAEEAAGQPGMLPHLKAPSPPRIGLNRRHGRLANVELEPVRLEWNTPESQVGLGDRESFQCGRFWMAARVPTSNSRR